MKHLTIPVLTAALFSGSLALAYAQSPTSARSHEGQGHGGSHLRIADTDAAFETFEAVIVRERVRVGPRPKWRFASRPAELREPAIEGDRPASRPAVGPPSKSRGRNR